MNLEYPEEAGAPEGSWSAWRKPEYLEEAGVPRVSWSTRSKLEYPEEAEVPGGSPRAQGDDTRTPLCRSDI